jgi:hypothetical protein
VCFFFFFEKKRLWTLVADSITSFLTIGTSSDIDAKSGDSFTPRGSPTSIMISSISSPSTTFHHQLQTLGSESKEVRSLEALQISVIQCLIDHILPQCRLAPTSVQWRLLALLNIGYSRDFVPPTPLSSTAAFTPTMSPTPGGGGGGGQQQLTAPLPRNERLSHACTNGLFMICRAGSNREVIFTQV